MLRALLSSIAPLVMVAHANTNAGGKLYMCTTPQPANLDAAGFAGLTWIEIKGLGNLGETGSNTNIVTYDTWGDDVVQKGKGMTNAGDPTVEVAYSPTDAGQIALRAAADTKLNYAFKIENDDKPDTDPDSTGTIRYNRGLVTGTVNPNGRNEDFQLDVFTLALNQKQVRVLPQAAP